jgi:hypothetical protein
LNFVGSIAHASPNTRLVVDEHLSGLRRIPKNDCGQWAAIIQQENPTLADQRTTNP